MVISDENDEIPEELKKRLLGAKDKFGSDPMGLAVAAGTRILEFYLGKEFVDAKVRLSVTPDSYMFNRFDAAKFERMAWVARVCILADAVFSLRNTTGFSVLVDRLINRPLRASFIEAKTAHHFQQCGFSVTMRKEIGKKREDFDFCAELGDRTINVEVTEVIKENFSRSTIPNKLREKRRQLPDSDPSILYCIVPADWHDQANLQFHLLDCTYECFSNSKRINAVVYEWEKFMDIGEGGANFEMHYPVPNLAPRHWISLDFLFRPSTISRGRVKSLYKGNIESISQTPHDYFDNLSYCKWLGGISKRD